MTVALRTLDPGTIADFERSGAAHLAPMLDRVERLLSVGSERAPNLVCVGAEVALSVTEQAAFGMTRVSATGTGDALAPALASCLAEATELLSTVPRRAAAESGARWLARLRGGADGRRTALLDLGSDLGAVPLF